MNFRGLKFDRSFAEERGQDLSEYCLLLALIILVAVGIFVKVAGGVQNLWTSVNTTITNASAAPSGSGSAVVH
jgi:Flp pilus assembly pilin Flp